MNSSVQRHRDVIQKNLEPKRNEPVKIEKELLNIFKDLYPENKIISERK